VASLITSIFSIINSTGREFLLILGYVLNIIKVRLSPFAPGVLLHTFTTICKISSRDLEVNSFKKIL
jgi:hypothetical protein